MSYCILRLQKFKAAAVRGIEIHDKRLRDVVHTNPDIDFERSHLNYNLTLTPQKNKYQDIVKKRIDSLDLKRAVRHDAIVMCQALVTSDKAFFDSVSEKKQREYFEHSLYFIEQQFGKENIISAVVHLDEKTPHMHVNFVPVTKDGRLNANSMMTRQKLSTLQDAFHVNVGQYFGLERGERGSKAKHVETARLKEQTVRNKRLATLDAIEEDYKEWDTLLDDVEKKQEQLDKITAQIKEASALYEEMLDTIEQKQTFEIRKEKIGVTF